MRFGILVCAFLVGCSPHFYNQGKHELAQKAVETFDQIELEQSIDEEYALLDSLLIRELEIVRNQTIARRDARLWQVIGANNQQDSYQYLDNEIKKRIAELMGSHQGAEEFLSNLKKIEEGRRFAQDNLDAYLVLRASDDPRPSCNVKFCADEEARQKLRQRFIDSEDPNAPLKLGFIDAFIKRCCEANALESSLEYPEGSQLAEISLKIDNIESYSAALKATIATNKAAYEQAKGEYETQLQPKKSAVDEQVKKLKDALDKVELDPGFDIPTIPGFENLNLEGKLEKLQLLKANIDELLTQILEDPDAVNEELNNHTRTALKVASFVKDFESRIGDLEYPQVSILLLESEFLKIELTAVQEQMGIAQQKLELLKKKRDLMTDELSYLVKALDNTSAILSEANCNTAQSYTALINSGQAECRQNASYALTFYTASWTHGRLEQELIDYRLIHLDHVSSLNNSVAALKQWNSLMKIPLNQMLQWEASGISAEQLSALILALGFTGIIATN